MNDVSTLMGKLKANVAYRQFNDSATEGKSTWPVIERMARAQTMDNPSAAPPHSPAHPAQPDLAQAVPTPVAPPVAASRLSFASRPAAIAAPLSAAPVSAMPAAPARSAPAQPATAPSAPALGGGSILRRYVAPANAPAAGPAPHTPGPRALSDIFAHLERKAP